MRHKYVLFESFNQSESILIGKICNHSAECFCPAYPLTVFELGTSGVALYFQIELYVRAKIQVASTTLIL